MRKLILTIFAAFCIVFSTTLAFADNIGININGVSVPFTDTTGSPFIDNTNHTQVPLRITMESYGCKVSWNQSTKSAVIEKDGTTVEVPIGVNYILKNGKKVSNDTSALVKDGKTYLPIRAVLEAFNADVSWDQDTDTVIVNSTSFNKDDIFYYSLFPEIPSLENITSNINFLFSYDMSDYDWDYDSYNYVYEADNWEAADLYAIYYVGLLQKNNFTITANYSLPQNLYDNEVSANYYYKLISPNKKYTVEVTTESYDSKTWLLGERDDRLADEIQISVTLN